MKYSNNQVALIIFGIKITKMELSKLCLLAFLFGTLIGSFFYYKS